jgi:hypothetical protein
VLKFVERATAYFIVEGFARLTGFEEKNKLCVRRRLALHKIDANRRARRNRTGSIELRQHNRVRAETNRRSAPTLARPSLAQHGN